MIVLLCIRISSLLGIWVARVLIGARVLTAVGIVRAVALLTTLLATLIVLEQVSACAGLSAESPCFATDERDGGDGSRSSHWLKCREGNLRS